MGWRMDGEEPKGMGFHSTCTDLGVSNLDRSTPVRSEVRRRSWISMQLMQRPQRLPGEFQSWDGLSKLLQIETVGSSHCTLTRH